jgi:hypothetical protein
MHANSISAEQPCRRPKMSAAFTSPLPISRRHIVVAPALALLGFSGCGGGDGEDGAGTPSGTTSRPARPARPCGTQSGTGCASSGSRVDLFEPAFSAKSTQIDNPLNPISNLKSGVSLGVVDGAPFRSETTLLPDTRTVQVRGVAVQLVKSQYMAFSDGRLKEIAIDYFAQDDDGNVWYFGEDVADYDEDGRVASNDGTWFFDKDNAQSAMITAAKPKVGNVWRVEDVAPIAWEEVTVKAIDVTADGPSGPLTGGLLIAELHMDGSREDKVFMPGYGEFRTGTQATNDLEALALMAPIDALRAPLPVALEAMSSASAAVFAAAGANDFTAAATSLASLTGAWNTYQTGQVPPLLKAEMARVLALLETVVDGRVVADTRDEAIALARVIHDLRLRYEPITQVDQVRLDLWLAQVAVDAADGAFGDIRGDAVTAAAVFDRFRHTLATSLAGDIAAKLSQLSAAAESNDAVNASLIASQIRAALSGGWK